MLRNKSVNSPAKIRTPALAAGRPAGIVGDIREQQTAQLEKITDAEKEASNCGRHGGAATAPREKAAAEVATVMLATDQNKMCRKV